MIYQLPKQDEAIDQGDLIEGCAVVSVAGVQGDQLGAVQVEMDVHRVIVLTQTCDLANKKVDNAVVASVFDAQVLVDRRILKAADIKGPLRAARVWGYYFLPAKSDLGLPEMIVDLRRLHTVRLD